MSAAKAGAAYFATIFAAGFILGTLRVFVLEPAFGATLAVLIELPVILAASWMVSARLIQFFRIEARLSPRLAMGLTAFGLLIGAEFVVGYFAFDRSLAEQLRHYATLHGAIGLGGQIVFALIPLTQSLLDDR